MDGILVGFDPVRITSYPLQSGSVRIKRTGQRQIINEVPVNQKTHRGGYLQIVYII